MLKAKGEAIRFDKRGLQFHEEFYIFTFKFFSQKINSPLNSHCWKFKAEFKKYRMAVWI